MLHQQSIPQRSCITIFNLPGTGTSSLLWVCLYRRAIKKAALMSSFIPYLLPGKLFFVSSYKIFHKFCYSSNPRVIYRIVNKLTVPFRIYDIGPSQDSQMLRSYRLFQS